MNELKINNLTLKKTWMLKNQINLQITKHKNVPDQCVYIAKQFISQLHTVVASWKNNNWMVESLL